jgi:hypothetical protein
MAMQKKQPKKKRTDVQPHKKRLADLAAHAHEGIERAITSPSPGDLTASSPDYPSGSSGGGFGFGWGSGGVSTP